MGEFKKIIIVFILCFIILNLYIIFNVQKTNNIKNNIVRLHVVASSNSISDQIVKLKVANKLEEFISSLNLESKNSSEILNTLYNKKDEILDISNYILDKENLDYNASISIGKIYYDNKESQTLHMDSGSYNSIKVMLGNAKGNNFWGLINPTKENISKIKELNTIFSGIKKIYNNNMIDNCKYKSFILNILNKEKEY